MSPRKTEERRRDGLLTVPTVWLEGDSPTPSTYVITEWGAPINILLAHCFGTARNPSQSVTTINKLSGKALEVEDRPITALVFGRLRGVMRLVSDGLLSIRSLINTWPFQGS